MSRTRPVERRRNGSPRAAGVALAAAFGAVGCGRHVGTPAAEPLRVAAAADLSLAFNELGAAYEKATGEHVVLSFGASGLLERQIVEGAPFDVFAAADVAFVDDAIASGACVASSRRLYAVGHLALVTRPGFPFSAQALPDLVDPRVKKVAIANPVHAPYGRAARQALERAGLWAAIEPKLVYGENVRQALQFAETGNADAAIVALSIADRKSPQVALVPSSLYDPLDQALVVCARGTARAQAAQRFCAYVTSADGRALLERYGFSAPGDPTPAGTAP